MKLLVCLTASALACALPAYAETSAPPPSRPVVVSGTVPDEATRQAILGRVRAVYGAEHVINQLGVGAVSTPANWSDYIQKLITPELRQIRNGELDINGNVLSLRGDVSNEQRIQEIPAQFATALNPTYQVRNGLRLGTNEQQLLDRALAGRIVEFAPASFTLTPRGTQLLDEMLAAMKNLGDRNIQIIGHTDSQGRPDANAALSQARADAVREYLIRQGLAGAQLISIGKGALEPVASNDTPEGRSRNRRIEFRIVN
ncbi:MAG: cell envelope biogenesis protein OmpA [Candidatus Dactylopiibacterium carminicum]|uniref:Cell envelope biogenesis protein OmpA n=1 Tax=Candidatus Dactylopiibacterium carminicum TaxID=857335 RepID=A0A272ENS1_9RHOO|nr:OmpA family protein [Candidatus Dactylopiibacterium carminicum]KAF7598132.1 cell envelope biogenesis protein OmpA [Candidatus Dactylopiibacterium carminicum]PAS91762.1 MAG: cell envelope biogenesis protein OmpA [Candidatus Dactylopiibacterium carminicum]PAS94133.1 MAG: cell envelope biogenesis protein OmpA [Candidatus Dactylopiibacterium carminicum]PAS96723.1 MAG: cell envelope biogenesis protein OmpA [Candidatus Dactylopiibacterium carminicum]